MNPAEWPALRARVGEIFGSKPRSHWTAVFADIDGCGAPVLDLDELANDPHLRARGTIVKNEDGTVTAAPAPRLSRTPGRLRPAPAGPGAQTREVLTEAGFTPAEIDALISDGTVTAAD
jgi:alpha-methylacyl-CoA racemase